MALAIGNGAYAHTSPLRNPGDDAREMKAVLEDLGFEVPEPVLDADFMGMRRALLNFRRAAAQSDVALIFYSGHGMELGGDNYLAPVDATLASEDVGRLESIALDDVRLAANGARRLSMVILDACRNNQFASQTRGSKGMTRLDDRRPGEVVLYATAAGALAQDGRGRLSPFTALLTERLRAAPDQEVRIMTSMLILPDAAQTPFALIGGMSETHVSLLAPHKRAQPIQTQPSAPQIATTLPQVQPQPAAEPAPTPKPQSA